MFSESEIVIQCKQCKGPCDDIKKCPLKSRWPKAQEIKIFPAMALNRELSTQGKCAYMQASDKYTTEELIKGLGNLNGHLQIKYSHWRNKSHNSL